MKQSSRYLIIFTDLDGTLLDHHSYSSRPACDLVDGLHEQAIARVIPVTSKTRFELESMEELSMFRDSLAIFENGSVISAVDQFPFFRQDGLRVLIPGVSYQDILDKIALLPSSIRENIKGFADMTTAEVAAETGLIPENARRAKQREATEPFLWSGSKTEMQDLQSAMAEVGVQIQTGGRFFHFTGKASKVEAMQMVVEACRKNQPETDYITVALGDGPNDMAMIEAADFGVIIPNPDGKTIASSQTSVRTAPAPGPHGWVKAVSEILEELGFNCQQS